MNPANDTARTGSCGAQHPGSIFGHRPCKLDRGHSGIHCNRAGDTWTRGPEELCAPHIPGAGPRLQVCEHCGQRCSTGGDGEIVPHYIAQGGRCSKARLEPVVLTPQRKVEKARSTANTTRKAMK